MSEKTLTINHNRCHREVHTQTQSFSIINNYFSLLLWILPLAMFYYAISKSFLIFLTLRSRGPSSLFLRVLLPLLAWLAQKRTEGAEKREKEKERGPFPSLLNPLSLSPSFPLSLGSLSNDDGDGNKDVKKAIGLLLRTTTLHVQHAFLYISLPSLHGHDVKMPNCKF